MKGLQHYVISMNAQSPSKMQSIDDNIIVTSVDKKVYNFTVAICLVVSDAEQYIQEWIDYHLIAMDFENIYIYDNSKTFELSRWFNNTRQHSIYNRVLVHHRPGKGTDDGKGRFLQAGVYQDCIKQYGTSKHGPQHDYFALIDVDEYLVPQTPRYRDIHGILEDYLVPYGGALVSNWMLFGSANRTIYSPVPVTKRFQYRDAKPHPVIKSIVKASDFRGNRNPHAVLLKDPKNVHTTEYPGAIQHNVYDDNDKTKASSQVKASKVLLVHHYRYTSEKEHIYKRCIRGGLIGRWCDKKKGTVKTGDEVPSHIEPRPGEVFDDQAWQLLISKVPKYRIYDTQEWKDFF
ncbi:glycosyl transferase family 2 protein [Nitzschia inconspicua]|uniref:Glycosyl transferase family 2 protein n=1 Tax=Nitzschia inconspicua TaxID=303405 RepID=A0A9K3KQ36_9STRA|nr:glycosyl transferase family 2 protein [Nitzschia inconspicua]